MNTIIWEYDPFARDSRACVVRDGKRDYSNFASNINEAADMLIALAYQNDIFDIKVHAPFAVSSELRSMIKDHERNQYSTNKITVEGI